MIHPPTPHQEEALAAISHWWKSGPTQPFRLGGLAGTGKTTTLGHVAEHLGVRPRYVTPTWKAAEVLTKKLPFGSTRATSIHNLIYKPVGVIHDDDCSVWEDQDCDMRCSQPSFAYDPNEGPPQLIIVDEASMVSQRMLEDLQRLDVPILMVGDYGQLPPVSAAAAFTEKLLDHRLTEILRQAQDSPVIRLAHKIRNEDRSWTRDANFIEQYRPDRDAHREGSAVLISNYRKDVVTSNERMRKLLGHKGIVTVGDRLMSLDNDKMLGVFNGQIGTVTSVEPVQAPTFPQESFHRFTVKMESGVIARGNSTLICLENDDLQYAMGQFRWRHAYGMTVHKSQGSSWPHVVIRGGINPRDKWKLLYTAVTRAEEKVTFLRS